MKDSVGQDRLEATSGPFELFGHSQHSFRWNLLQHLAAGPVNYTHHGLAGVPVEGDGEFPFAAQLAGVVYGFGGLGELTYFGLARRAIGRIGLGRLIRLILAGPVRHELERGRGC